MVSSRSFQLVYMKIHVDLWIRRTFRNAQKHMMIFLKGEISCPSHPPKGSGIYLDYYRPDMDGVHADDVIPVTENNYTYKDGVLRPEIVLEDIVVYGKPQLGCITVSTEAKTIEAVARQYEKHAVPNLIKQGFRIVEGPIVDPNPIRDLLDYDDKLTPTDDPNGEKRLNRILNAGHLMEKTELLSNFEWVVKVRSHIRTYETLSPADIEADRRLDWAVECLRGRMMEKLFAK